ncbi:MAG: carbohydrate ABC transporter permease [Brevinema sp.]
MHVYKHWCARVLFFIILLPLALLFIFPLIWMVVTSLKSESQIFADINSFRAFLPPTSPMSEWLKNYVDLSLRFPIMKYISNSIWYSSLSVIVACTLNSLAGYALARMNIPYRHVLLSLVIATMIVPVETTMLPLYLIVRGMKGLNSSWGYLFPFAANAMYIFLFRQFFLGLPKELEEASRLDGANAFQTFFLVILPNCLPIFATIAIFSFIAVWNDFLWAIMVFSDASKQTVQVGLQSFMAIQPTYTGQVMAALTLATIPMICVYTFFQKYIVQGMAHTAVKE